MAMVAAILMIGAFVCCPILSDAAAADESYVVNVESSADYCGVNTTLSGTNLNKVTYTLSGNDEYHYKVELLDSDGKTVENVISDSAAKGQLSAGKRSISVTAPLESGNYTFVAKFYGTTDTGMTGEPLAEKTAPLKIVDPIVLKYILKNEGTNAVTLSVYFVINGERVSDSAKDVTITAGGTQEVTYNYYVKDVEDCKYYLDTDSTFFKDVITGLGEDNTKTFYAHDSDYSLITTIVVVVLVIMGIILFFVLRKPVVNKGKPKGRR